MKQKPPPISAEQRALLDQYAHNHGTHWYMDLLHDWARGAVPGPLHALRNSHGPSWLKHYVESLGHYNED